MTAHERSSQASTRSTACLPGVPPHPEQGRGIVCDRRSGDRNVEHLQRTRESAARADSAERALERPAPGFSACRECCVSACLVAGCGGGLPGGFWLQIYGFTDLRIHPPPSPSRDPAVRRRSGNQVGAGVRTLVPRAPRRPARLSSPRENAAVFSGSPLKCRPTLSAPLARTGNKKKTSSHSLSSGS